MNEGRKKELLHNLEKYRPRIKPIKENEFTVQDYVEEYGVSRSSAENYLMGLVSDGVLEKNKRLSKNRKHCWAYMLIDNEDKDGK